MNNVRQNVVVFSGAGMSAESGVNTFRDSNGLWENYAIEDVATPQAWERNPNLVQKFYNERRRQILSVAPNAAHYLIADLQNSFDVQVITQNIDDLHERAGSQQVLHLHGEIRKAKSSGPNAEKKYYPIEGWELTKEDCCEEGYPLRPHVVWFGEPVPLLETAAEVISRADVLIVIGTSLQVYPAAGLIHYAPQKARKIIIDPKVHEMNIPHQFERLCHSAIEGMKWVFQELNKGY